MRRISDSSRRDPSARVETLTNKMDIMQRNAEIRRHLISQFISSAAERPRLASPVVSIANSPKIELGDFTRNILGRELSKLIELRNWSIIGPANEEYKLLLEVAGPMGVLCQHPEHIIIDHKLTLKSLRVKLGSSLTSSSSFLSKARIQLCIALSKLIVW